MEIVICRQAKGLLRAMSQARFDVISEVKTREGIRRRGGWWFLEDTNQRRIVDTGEITGTSEWEGTRSPEC